LGSGWGLRAPALSLRVARVVGVDEEFGSFIKKIFETLWIAFPHNRHLSLRLEFVPRCRRLRERRFPVGPIAPG
jgi:hypothetical protein